MLLIRNGGKLIQTKELRIDEHQPLIRLDKRIMNDEQRKQYLDQQIKRILEENKGKE